LSDLGQETVCSTSVGQTIQLCKSNDVNFGTLNLDGGPGRDPRVTFSTTNRTNEAPGIRRVDAVAGNQSALRVSLGAGGTDVVQNLEVWNGASVNSEAKHTFDADGNAIHQGRLTVSGDKVDASNPNKITGQTDVYGLLRVCTSQAEESCKPLLPAPPAAPATKSSGTEFTTNTWLKSKGDGQNRLYYADDKNGGGTYIGGGSLTYQNNEVENLWSVNSNGVMSMENGIWHTSRENVKRIYFYKPIPNSRDERNGGTFIGGDSLNYQHNYIDLFTVFKDGRLCLTDPATNARNCITSEQLRRIVEMLKK
jgi:hypothetical protein